MKQIIPSMVTKIVQTFDFEFVDKSMYDEDWLPIASFLQSRNPPINVKVTAKV